MVQQLKRLDGEANRKKHLDKVIAAADTVIAQIDTETLCKHYGVKLKLDDEEAKAERAKLDKKLNTLTDALFRKGARWATSTPSFAKAKTPIATKPKRLEEIDKQFEANFAELQNGLRPRTTSSCCCTSDATIGRATSPSC